MSTTRSSARRPRRPAGSKHDPDGVNELELMDERRLQAAHGRTTTPPVEPLVLVGADVLLLTAGTECRNCRGRTPVHVLAAMPEFETSGAEARLLCRINHLPPALDKAVRTATKGRLRPENSLRATGAHWLNHCDGCGAAMPEAAVLGSSGPFQPQTYAQRRAIRTHRVPGPFALDSVHSWRSVPLLDWLAWRRQLADKRAAASAVKAAMSRAARSA